MDQVNDRKCPRHVLLNRTFQVWLRLDLGGGGGKVGDFESCLGSITNGFLEWSEFNISYLRPKARRKSTTDLHRFRSTS